MKEKIQYEETLAELRQLDKKIECLEACFLVISQAEMIDSVNYQLLGLKLRRHTLLAHLRGSYAQK